MASVRSARAGQEPGKRLLRRRSFVCVDILQSDGRIDNFRRIRKRISRKPGAGIWDFDATMKQCPDETLVDEFLTHRQAAFVYASGHWGRFDASRFPNDAGLVFKVLGMESQVVKQKVREFWAIAREVVAHRETTPKALAESYRARTGHCAHAACRRPDRANQ